MWNFVFQVISIQSVCWEHKFRGGKNAHTPCLQLLIIVTYEFAACSQELMPKKANLEDLEELRKRPGKMRNALLVWFKC